MYLIINTADNENIHLILARSQDDFVVKKIPAKFKQSEKLLINVEKLLIKEGIKLLDLKGIGVVTGPGGFTALRIGIATANTLAYSLKIPVIGVNSSEFESDDGLVRFVVKNVSKTGKHNIVMPEYGREPNIG